MYFAAMNAGRKINLKVALLDLYEGVANQGMRCIREILHEFAQNHAMELQLDEFEVRQQMEIPGMDYDVYVSSGGPGSPLDSAGSEWEEKYFKWISTIEQHNHTSFNKKHILFICHSFQLACRYFDVATVNKRKSTAFGVFPVHLLFGASKEPIFKGLNDPFYTVDSRDYQVVQPRLENIHKIGGEILAIEKARPHVPYERAVMAIRFNSYMIGTQFHPEADASGMLQYLMSEEKKQLVIEQHGEEKWHSMTEQLNDPQKIMHTYAHVLPNFLHNALPESIKHSIIPTT